MRPLITSSAGRPFRFCISRRSQYTAAVCQSLLPWRTAPPSPSVARPFSVSAYAAKKQMPSRPKPPPEDEIDEMFVKGTGPGGQKINKTNSAVQLRHKPTGIVVKSQATRSRTENRAIARSLLAARLDELANGAESRTAVVAAAKQKKRANATKKARRKYRKLEEEEAKAGEVEGEEGAEDEGAAIEEEGEETHETSAKPEPENKSMNGSARDSTEVATDEARKVEEESIPRSKENAGSDQ